MEESSDNNKKQQPKKGGGFKAPIPVPSSIPSCSSDPFADLEMEEKDPNDSKTTVEFPTSTTPDVTPKAKPAPKKAAAPRKKKNPDCPAAAAPAPAQVDADPENAENIEPQPQTQPPPVKKPRVRAQKKKVEAEAETPESAVEALAEKPPVLKKSRSRSPRKNKKAVTAVPPVLEAETDPLSTDGENQDQDADADPYSQPNEEQEMESKPKRKRAKKEYNLSAEVLKDYDDTIDWVIKHWKEDSESQEDEDDELEKQCSPKARRSCSSPPSIDVSPKSEESMGEAESSGVEMADGEESEEMDEFAFSQLSQAPAPVGGIPGVPALVGGH